MSTASNNRGHINASGWGEDTTQTCLSTLRENLVILLDIADTLLHISLLCFSYGKINLSTMGEVRSSSPSSELELTDSFQTYSCTFANCDKVFLRSYELKKHTATHEDPNRYAKISRR